MDGVNEVKRTDGQKGEMVPERARLRWKDFVQRGLGRVEEKWRMRVYDRGNWRVSTEKNSA